MNKIIKTSLSNALGVAVYVGLVAYVMQHGERIFGKMQNFWGPFAFLMLFVVSAAVVGSLVFAQPVLYYLEDKKKEAVGLFAYTILWLILATVIVFFTLFLIK